MVSKQPKDFADKLSQFIEVLPYRDCLDAIWNICTNIGEADPDGQQSTLIETRNQYGYLMQNCHQSEKFMEFLDQGDLGDRELIVTIALLSSRLLRGLKEEVDA